MDERRPPTLGAVIRAHRDRVGMTRAELARRSNISLSYLAKIEQGLANNPTQATVAAIERALSSAGTDTIAFRTAVPDAAVMETPIGAVSTVAIYPPGDAPVEVDLEALSSVAAVLLTPTMKLISTNRLYRLLLRGVDDHPSAAGWMFTDVRARIAHVRWEREAARVVWWLRQHTGDDVDAIVEQLSINADFARLWRDPLLRVASETDPVALQDPETGATVDFDSALFRQVSGGGGARYLHILSPRAISPGGTPG